MSKRYEQLGVWCFAILLLYLEHMIVVRRVINVHAGWGVLAQPQQVPQSAKRQARPDARPRYQGQREYSIGS